MATYIGSIDLRSNFYNFSPLAILKEKEIAPLSSQEKEYLLLDSRNGNINLYYDYRRQDQQEFMRDTFVPGSLMAFSFELEDLEDNYNYDGIRNQTGYKINAQTAFNSKKIRPISDYGVYQLITKEDISNNFYKEPVVILENLQKNLKVLVALDDDTMYYGPYETEERERDRAIYILPRIKESSFTIKGFRRNSCIVVPIRDEWQNKDWDLVIAVENSVHYKDIISDDELVSSFQDSLVKDGVVPKMVETKEISNLIDRCNASVISNPNIPKDIRERRFLRLKELLTSADLFRSNFDSISELIGKSVVSFINSNPNSEVSDELVHRLLQEEDFAENIKDQRLLSARIDKSRQEFEDLKQQIDSASEEIEKLNAKKESLMDEYSIEAQQNVQNEEIQKLVEERKLEEEKLSNLSNRLKLANDIESLQKEHADLTDRVRSLHQQETYASESFQEIFEKNQKKMQEIVFDGFVSNKLMQAAAKWETREQSDLIGKMVNEENRIQVKEKNPEELTDYLFSRINKARPSYDRNVVTNIAICMFQGFLTVFSGDPGCGKTSICNLMAEVLGLTKLSREYDGLMDRYIQVSVERGWTSKRDLIGYYNPLSKTFDKSDRRLFDGLSLLSKERENSLNKFPFLILLDEANLSPMEYYWADFMNVCDDLKRNNRINFGEEYVFSIPETLHFVATINNDHTTETLSPRLIDRAWIITLPSFSYSSYGKEINEDETEVISWKSIKEAFVPDMSPDYELPSDIKQVYDDKIKAHLQKMRMAISSRTDLSIKKYFLAASRLFEKKSEYEDVNFIAFDYAIAQKILPRINGNGSEFKKLLEGLRDIFRDNSLQESQARIQQLIEHGSGQMDYYNYFN